MNIISLTKNTLFLGVFFLCHLAYASLPSDILAKVQSSQIHPDNVSVWIKAIGDSAPIVNHLGQTPRTPASTQKLITTAIALNVMGENHRWYTDIYHRGMIHQGTLYGDLIIKGNGDPAMTHTRLNAMLSALPAHGIRHIQGDILIDNSAFYHVARNVNAFDGQGLRAYNAQPNAFLINFGTLEVAITPSGALTHTGETDKDGNPKTTFIPTDTTKAGVQILPPLADFHAPNVVQGTTGNCTKPKFSLSGHQLSITTPFAVACGQMSEWLTFADGDEFAKKAVKGVWQTIDPAFQGTVKIHHHSHLPIKPIMRMPSSPLSEQIYNINQHSNNVMTEQVALSLPLFLGKTQTSYTHAFGFIDAWWKKHLKSPPPIMSRASGLCRDCAVLPSALGELLEFSHQQPNFNVYKNSLPIIGETGTMKVFANRNPNSPAIGQGFIKTGRLSEVASIAGYVQGQSGKTYAVVAIINQPNVSNQSNVFDTLDEVLNWTVKQ